MALKRKLSKADHEALPEHLKGEYVEKSGQYFLDVDGDDDTSALKNAKDREKARADAAEKKAQELQDAIDAADLDKNKGNVEAIEKAHLKKIEAMQKAHETALTDVQNKLTGITSKTTKMMADDKAHALASELSGANAKLLLPHLQSRIRAEFDDDGSPVTRVLDAQGNVTTQTLADLKQEFVANKEFSAIITASKASGGATKSTVTPNGGGAANPNDKPTLSGLRPRDLLAHIESVKSAT